MKNYLFQRIKRIRGWIIKLQYDQNSYEMRYPDVRIDNPERLNLSTSCRILPGTRLLGNANINVAERAYIGEECVITASSPVSIGNDTMIAARVAIITGTHDYNQNPMWKIAVSRPISIGNHVWIGLGAIILPGVKIGNFAVVGAGSVVSRHVPEGAIVAGNPAKILRYRKIPPLDKEIVEKYPYWEDVFKDFLPPEKILK